MLQFVQSAWLWASAGIIVPVIIHLWNVKQGKTLKVGSIAFLTESVRSHAKSFKLSDLLLLLLRCLLLMVLAMLIAKPFYEKRVNNHKEKGWIVIEKKQVDEVYNKFKPTIDSLIQCGFTFHYFNRGLPEAKFENVLKIVPDTVKEAEVSYWTLLRELDQKAPSNLPLYLFTDNSLRRFSGSRPAVSLILKWNIYTSPDTAFRWIEKAYKTTNDSIRLIVGNSGLTRTYYTYQNISPGNKNNDFSLKAIDGKSVITFIDSSKAVSHEAVEVDTSTLVITIYADKFAMDATYLKAAIDAVKDFTKYKIKVSVVTNVQSIQPNSNWLFWLSEETLPVSLIKNNVFVYEKGMTENIHSQLVVEDRLAGTTAEDIRLFKTIQRNLQVGALNEIIWKNGFGEPVLTVEKQNGSICHFYSRFNPQWNDLTWSEQFPQIIFSLLYRQDKLRNKISGADKRIMDVNQVQPVISTEENITPKQSLVDKKDLSKVFWLIAFILFIIERMLSFKAKKEEVYG